ncbi:Hsp70 family protein [Micromonospora sp. LOL_023]|uniref:Hsp70 family protein n=1 Tax=Micromonospora sp. LOL_023 TaxID=3345418 RepID=UPI003A83DC7E
MRDTIDFGIDLGTTNSAIAVVEQDGSVAVIKNNDGWDITPSAVWIPKPGVVHVGRKARDRVENDPDNAAAEFKLEMGLADAGKDFVDGNVRLTPPQLSAEVLKSLRADAAHHTGLPPDAAVITVPAAFSLNQNKATLEAATLAGFSPGCPLVQEPTAAAFAYGFHDTDDRAYWMVFDFGGGTFDAAVVSKRDGDLRVLDHAGDPYLGGKLIDWAVVERVLAPAAAAALDLPEFRRDNPAWRANFAKLKGAAEDAKIQLSRRATADLMVELTVGGGTETFEYTLRRDELDRVAEPFYARAMNLCRKALTDGGLDPGDIDRLLLVGGVTLAPGLRERLADDSTGLGIALDTSLDPTTVVARGAAIFASTVRHPHPQSFQPTADTFRLELAYEPSVTTTNPVVAGRVHAADPKNWTGYGVIVSNPAGQPPFRSGRIALTAEGAFLTEVDIDQHTTSRLTVELTDPSGMPRPVVPDSLSITHRDVEFGGARLTHSLGIQLAEQVAAVLLRKGATLPARAREVFRTSATLLRSDTEAMINIPVVQGERSRADRNRQVGMLNIRPLDLRIDLPAGTEVEVTFEVDTSNLVSVVADVPLIQTQFDAVINLDDVRAPQPAALAAALADAEQRLTAVAESTGSSTDPAVRQRLRRLDEEGTVTTAREQVRAASVDAGAAATAEDRLLELNAQIDDIEEATERPVLVRELQDRMAESRDLVASVGSRADQQELANLDRRATAAIESQNSTRISEVVGLVTDFIVSIERRQPGWAAAAFYWLRSEQARMQPASQAAALVREGEQALANNDERVLDSVNSRLARLLPRDVQTPSTIWLTNR